MIYPSKPTLYALTLLALSIFSAATYAHGVDSRTEVFLTENTGVALVPFVYIGAKHMITGYDHLLFLLGVLFFLYSGRDILLYISLFTLGHSLTLLLGVLASLQMNPWLIDALIGLSVLYKGFDNLGGFRRCLGWQPDNRVAVLLFGLIHGFGLATKLQQFELANDGLLVNLVAFNIGVELGQLAALLLVLIALASLRFHPGFKRLSLIVNTLLISAGMVLMGYQMTGYYHA